VAAGNGLPERNVLPTRSVTFTCREDPVADGDDVCGPLDAQGAVVPDSAAADAAWTKVETFTGSGRSTCGSCHDTPIAATHFQINTLDGVETCDVCHGDGRFMDPVELHIPSP
jgi:cytochrome c5